MKPQTTEWTGCYEGGWQYLIVPEAFAHPAKFSYKLTERMIAHAISKGWVRPGGVVVDPFGGIGCGGIVAAYSDLVWVGCELEQKFVDLGKQNFELHRRKWEKLGSPMPTILHGDSRKLSEVIERADIVVSSPPYAEGLGHGGQPTRGEGRTDDTNLDAMQNGYGQTPGNLGNNSGPTFWQAAREIVSECHKILRPGGHAIWVVKDFVRKGERVDFCGDWERLCESVGFKTVCKHRAMLVKETNHNGLFGEIKEKKERKSFFRRLAEKKGSPRIDWEMVICMERP